MRYETPASNTTPRSFTVAGKSEETFHCHPTLAADDIEECFNLLFGDENGKVNWDDYLAPFFRKCMAEAEFDRFVAFLDDKDNLVQAQLIYRIAKDLYGEYSGRPFDELVRSLASRIRDSESSAPASPSPEATGTG